MSFILASRLRRAWPISERVLVFQLVHQVLSANFVSVQGTTTRKRCLTDEQRSDAISVTLGPFRSLFFRASWTVLCHLLRATLRSIR